MNNYERSRPTGIINTKDGEVKFISIPPKPILVIYSPTSTQQRIELRNSLSKEIMNDYHVLIFYGDRYETKIFYEKDQVELNQEMLEELLSIHKK